MVCLNRIEFSVAGFVAGGGRDGLLHGGWKGVCRWPQAGCAKS